MRPQCGRHWHYWATSDPQSTQRSQRQKLRETRPGDYGCGGVQAALKGSAKGVLGNWIRPINDLYLDHREELESITDNNRRLNRLCEINVHAQVTKVCRTAVVKNAWEKGRKLTVHGWIYNLQEGHITKLEEVGP